MIKTDRKKKKKKKKEDREEELTRIHLHQVGR